jgi:CubicO group peptidase (beta-lactamase class C family)
MANFEWQVPNTPATKFRLGSITKQFTSMLVMQLVEEGKLKLDAKLSEMLPYYRKDTGEKVTLHHLLTHTSGIPSYTGIPNFMRDQARDPYEVEAFVKKFCSGDLEFEPGSKYAYNNSGYFLLGAILEHATGKKYEDLLQERIFGPLGMDDTGYDRADRLIPHRAAGYQKDFDSVKNAPYLDMSIPYAAGSLYSTVEDLHKWDRALYGTKLLSAAGKEKMFTPFLQNYAYGWVIAKAPGPKPDQPRNLILHGGGIHGFNTLLIREPERQRLIVLLSNLPSATLNRISAGIAGTLDGSPVPPPQRPIAEVIGPVITQASVDGAIAKYRELKGSFSAAEYDFSEPQLNLLGYALMNRKRLQDAIAIFKLNVEMFPRSANVYDSLGEAYMNDGKKELAITNYEKALELDKTMTSAQSALKKLRGETAAAP